MTEFLMQSPRFPHPAQGARALESAFAKQQFVSHGSSFPLPMHGLTLSGFERAPPINLRSAHEMSFNCSRSALPSILSKRCREFDDAECEIPRMGTDSSDCSPTQLQGPTSDGETSSRSPKSDNNQDRILFLKKENCELSAKVQATDDELHKLRDLIHQLFDVEKAHKRAKDESKPQRRYWNNDEHERFLQALQRFGPKDVKAIATFVGTRNATQVRTHAQKYFQKLARIRSGGSADGESSGEEPCSPTSSHPADD